MNIEPPIFATNMQQQNELHFQPNSCCAEILKWRRDLILNHGNRRWAPPGWTQTAPERTFLGLNQPPICYSHSSPIPNPEEEGEEKGSGFSHSCMRLIISNFNNVLISGRAPMMSSKSHGWLYDVATYHLGNSMSNQHKKNMTLTDFVETWFLHRLCWDIHPQSVSAFYVAWLQS